MIGKMLCHYKIARQLGKGEMGEVYQAKDQKLGREDAAPFISIYEYHSRVEYIHASDVQGRHHAIHDCLDLFFHCRPRG